MAERVTGMDAAFLELESPTMHLHVVGVLVLDPSTAAGGFTPERLAQLFTERLHLIPPFRRKVVEVPGGLDHPRWIEDDGFDLGNHLIFHDLGGDATTDDLERFVGEVSAEPLRRDVPLWQTNLVEGFADGTVAVVTKIHHALMDGSAGGDIMTMLLDLTPDPPEPAAPDGPADEGSAAETGERPPSARRLLLGVGPAAFMRLARVPGAIWHTVSSMAGSAKEVAAQPGAILSFAPTSPLNGPLTPHRTVAFRRCSLDDLQLVHHALDVTINDVVLAATTMAMRGYLVAREETPTEPLVASVPVDRRRDGEQFGNHTSNILVRLPVQLDDARAVVASVHETSTVAKAAGQALDSTLLDRWIGLLPAALLTAGAAVYSRFGLGRHHPPIFNTIVSNMPGPPMPLYLAGAQIVALYPMGPLIANTGLNLTVLSHDGKVDVGIIACPDLVDDVGELADRFVDAVAALVTLSTPPPDLGTDMVDVPDPFEVEAGGAIDLRDQPDLNLPDHPRPEVQEVQIPDLPRPTLAVPEGAG
jgi:WS/DGAT/MGAT family acyltransferase